MRSVTRRADTDSLFCRWWLAPAFTFVILTLFPVFLCIDFYPEHPVDHLGSEFLVLPVAEPSQHLLNDITTKCNYQTFH